MTAEQLTRRERDVLIRIAVGMTDPEIARELHISVSTLKTHTARLFVKLGARNRTHAVTLAWVRGDLVVRDGQVTSCES